MDPDDYSLPKLDAVGAAPIPKVRPKISDDAWSTPMLGSEEATALRSVLRELADDDLLEDFLDGNCLAFKGYVAGGEQQLEWTQLHKQYITSMEARIAQLASASELISSDRLFSLLAGVVGKDERAGAFIVRLLSMADYAHFCSMMASRAAEAQALQQFQQRARGLQLVLTER